MLDKGPGIVDGRTIVTCYIWTALHRTTEGTDKVAFTEEPPCKKHCGSRTCALLVGGLRRDVYRFLLKASDCRRQQHGGSVRSSMSDNQASEFCCSTARNIQKGMTEARIKYKEGADS